MRRRLALLAAPLLVGTALVSTAALTPGCAPWRYDSRADATSAYWQQWDAHKGWAGHAGDPVEQLFPPGCTP